ncbi:hypothetical protein ACTFTM_13150 [Micromonospora sp. RB23]
MKNRTRSTILLSAFVAVIMLGSAAYAAYSWTRRTAVDVRTAPVIEPSVKISGAVRGLLPGGSAMVVAVIGNGNDFPVQVTSIKGGNTATGGGCPEWAVRVVEPDTKIVVRGRSTKKVPVRIRMEEWADEKCAGQQFSLEILTTISPA